MHIFLLSFIITASRLTPFVSSSALPASPLGEIEVSQAKRDDTNPCALISFGHDSYDVLPLNPPVACLGFTVDSSVHCNPWTGQDYEDIQNAVAQQATKDGQFQYTTVGRWTVAFPLFITTAFANRDTSSFAYLFTVSQEDGVNGAGGSSAIGATAFAYQSGNDVMQINADVSLIHGC
jgi:hypothetical protein